MYCNIIYSDFRILNVNFLKFSNITLKSKKSARFAGTFSSRASRAARKFERA